MNLNIEDTVYDALIDLEEQGALDRDDLNITKISKYIAERIGFVKDAVALPIPKESIKVGLTVATKLSLYTLIEEYETGFKTIEGFKFPQEYLEGLFLDLKTGETQKHRFYANNIAWYESSPFMAMHSVGKIKVVLPELDPPVRNNY